MSNFDEFDLDAPMQFEVSLNIRDFVRGAVRQNLKRNDIMVYLYLVSTTYEATDQMRRFFPIAQEHNLSRNEILIWLHIAYGGSSKPKHISDKLRIPVGWVEKALAVLDAKNIIVDSETL